MVAVQLKCPDCAWQTTCGLEQVVLRLRTLGLLRRATHPPEEMVHELLRANLPRLACDQCGHAGLLLGEDSGDDADWQQAIVCEVCRKPISPERLEVLPNSIRCVGCQDVADRGEEPEELEFCERCGALVELRVSHAGGLTRYKRFCTGDPPCRL
jgi:hypothetical protein